MRPLTASVVLVDWFDDVEADTFDAEAAPVFELAAAAEPVWKYAAPNMMLTAAMPAMLSLRRP